MVNLMTGLTLQGRWCKLVDTDKKEFWAMLNVAMELCNRPPLSKEAVVTYWHMLKGYDLSVVRESLDKWVDSSSKAPTPHDIKDLCKPVTPIYNAIARKADKEANKQHVKELMGYIAENLKPKTDYKAWAKRILANPQNFPENSVKAAIEVMGE